MSFKLFHAVSLKIEKVDGMFTALNSKKLCSKTSNATSAEELYRCPQCMHLFCSNEKFARLAYIQDYPLSKKLSNAPWFRVLNLALEKERNLSGGHFCLQYTRSFWDMFNKKYKNSK